MRYYALPAALLLALPVMVRGSMTDRAPEAAAPAEIRRLITSYRLVEVGGKSLPMRIENEWRCHKDIRAGTLVLSADGRWLLQTLTREVCGNQTRDSRNTDDGLYQSEAGTMRFLHQNGQAKSERKWRAGSDTDLDELNTGIIGSDGTLIVRLTDGHTDLVFRRVIHRVMPRANHRGPPVGPTIRIAGLPDPRGTIGGELG